MIDTTNLDGSPQTARGRSAHKLSGLDKIDAFRLFALLLVFCEMRIHHPQGEHFSEQQKEQRDAYNHLRRAPVLIVDSPLSRFSRMCTYETHKGIFRYLAELEKSCGTKVQHSISVTYMLR